MNCRILITAEFFLSELSDFFSFLFLYDNGHASILINQLCRRNVAVHKLQLQQQHKNAAIQSGSLQQHFFFIIWFEIIIV